MRVGMVAYAHYDSNRRIEQYANALVMRGDQVDVLALNRGGDPKFETLAGVNVYRAQNRTRRRENFLTYVFQVAIFMVRSFWFLTKKQFENPYDVIHVHSVPDFLVFSALIPKLFGVPVILDIHDILPEFYSMRFRAGEHSLIFKLLVLIEQASVAFSDHVIVANLIWRERLLRRSAKPTKVTAIWNYPDPQIFFPREKTRSDGKFVLTYPGSLNWHQGLDIAIRAFAKVIDRIPEAEFWIYGEGPERENLIRLAHELGIDGKILFRGFLPIREVAELMANSDLAIVPKRASSTFGTEAASTKIMEFMSLGIPVIVSRTKIDSLYHNEATVEFFDSDDSDALARAILQLYSSPERRSELAANSLAYVAQNKWDLKKADYFAVVDNLARPRVSTRQPEAKRSVAKNDDR
jgi:glycosyltransferase involved in cell wall biosynthesis